MKKFIILSIFLVSTAVFAMEEKREREGIEEAQATSEQESKMKKAKKEMPQDEQDFWEFRENLAQHKGSINQEAFIFALSNEKLKNLIAFMQRNNLQLRFPDLYDALNNRVFIQSGEGTIRHYNVRVLNAKMETIKNLIADNEKEILGNKMPLPLPPTITDREFFSLYQIAIALSSIREELITKKTMRERYELALHPITVILNRNGLTSTEVLEAAYYLSLEKLILTALAQETAREIAQYKKAFPVLTVGREYPGVFYADFLPANIQKLDKNILALIMRQFYLIHPNEHKLRTISTCFDPNDMFCSKALRINLSIEPFPIGELIFYGKINYIASEVLDLSSMHINSLDGFNMLQIKHLIKNLSLAGNQIEQLPENFLQECQALDTLSLANNPIRQLPNTFLAHNRSLKLLNINQCHLEQLPDNFLQNCPSLRVLKLSNNPLQQLPNNFLVHNQHLLELDLSQCHLQQLPLVFLEHNQQLTKVLLENNQLQVLPLSVVINKPHLAVLRVQNNQLNNLNANVIRGILTHDGKVIDGVNIILEPQNAGAQLMPE